MIYGEDPFRRKPENRWPGENDRRGLSEWRKIWPNCLPDEGQSSKPDHRMAAEGIQFPWRGNGSTVSTDLDVIWGMSARYTFLSLLLQISSRVWTQLIHNLMAKMWTMARKLRVSFSKRVASLRMSFMVQKKRSTMLRIL